MSQMIHTPVGVRDLYGLELQRKNYVMDKINHQMHLYGYKDIETPVFEFLEVFSEKKGINNTKELYKFFDKEGNTLCLRPDFTPSIARCASKYFLEDGMPIRLCYSGKSFINASELQGKLKESTQMGVELIEPNSKSPVEDDAEILTLMAESLLSIGLTDFNITINQIEYFKGICSEANLSENDIEKLRDYISVKNYFGAEEFLNNLNVDKNTIDCLLNVSDLTTIDELKNLQNKLKSKEALAAIDRIIELYNLVKISGYEKYLSFDLTLINRFDYYTGVIFRAYTYGVGDAIIKGGRYDILIENATAVGFVFLIDEIMSALNAGKLMPEISYNNLWIVYSDNNYKEALTKIVEYRAKNIPITAIAFDNNKFKSKSDYLDYATKNGITEVIFMID